MKKLLVTTDFSRAAANALNYAADMAASLDAEIYLLHVVESVVGFSEVPMPVDPEDLVPRVKEEFRQIEEEFKNKTKGRINITTEIEFGGFLPALKQYCSQLDPYAVVMGSQGKTAAEHIFFGSHATLAVQELEWPVITIPPLAVFTGIKKIALATDLTGAIESAPLEEIKMLVQDFEAELHILNIGKKEIFDAEVIFRSRMLGEKTKALNPKFHFNTSDKTEEGIIDFVNRFHIDLLIVLPRRRNLLKTIMQKSHSKHLVLHSYAPVLALH